MTSGQDPDTPTGREPHAGPSLRDAVSACAQAHGADLVGFARIEAYGEFLREVRQRLHETGATGDDYMLPGADALAFFAQLADPRDLLPEARALIVLGTYAYDTQAVYRGTRRQLRGKTARTYRYYPVVRHAADRVAALLEARGHRARYGQDVPLKHVASRIGLGAYGKNGLLLTRAYGSYVGLRSVLTTAEIEPDPPAAAETPCASCDRCLKACPTGALYAPYKVDPQRCINPMTRRDRPIPTPDRRHMGNWLCGCDVCQEVCPANRGLALRPVHPRAGFDPAHHDSHAFLGGVDPTPRLAELIADRGRPALLRRNAIIALGNCGVRTEEAQQILAQADLRSDPSLAEYARWAEALLAGRGNNCHPEGA